MFGSGLEQAARTTWIEISCKSTNLRLTEWIRTCRTTQRLGCDSQRMLFWRLDARAKRASSYVVQSNEETVPNWLEGSDLIRRVSPVVCRSNLVDFYVRNTVSYAGPKDKSLAENPRLIVYRAEVLHRLTPNEVVLAM